MRRIIIAIALCLLPSASGCSDSQTRHLDVFAAASLTDAFDAIESMFEEQNEAVEVRVNALASSDLASQIEQGAPADVFASADIENMKRLQDQGLILGSPEVFARNRLAILVQSGNPKGIRSLEDLTDPSLVVSLAAPAVPAGKYAQELFDKASVEVDADSQEQDVRAVVARVASGEADAGIVYETDAAIVPETISVSIPDRFNVVARYPIALVAGSQERPLAKDFMKLVLSSQGRDILRSYGFEGP